MKAQMRALKGMWEGLSCSIVGGPNMSRCLSPEGRGGMGAREAAVHLRLLLVQRMGRKRPH